MLLFLRYLFDSFDLRKVYAETTASATFGIDRIVRDWPCFHEEGRLRETTLSS